MIKVIRGKEQKVFAENGKNLLDLLQENGYMLSADCGGNGKCGKCLVDILYLGERKKVLACKTTPLDGMTVFVDDDNASIVTFGVDDFDVQKSSGLGLALDVGTTTLAFSFVDLSNGKTIKTASCLNPERSFGADVISRISYAKEKGVASLTDCLKEKVNEVINRETASLGEKIKTLVVTGNTVMQHLFVGENIVSFGEYPYSPVFLEKREYDISLGYNADKVILLPSFSSFVGADIACGGIATDIEKGNNLLVDLGTNGEILCHNDGEILTTSVAAGPAFEGADIECGMGGIKGAICSVKYENGKTTIQTIENGKPIGICGSGLIDAIAIMLDQNVIDESGAFTGNNDKFFLTDDVYVSAKDVRKFQLAKSAVRSGIDTVLNKIGAKTLDNLFICGGLGYYFNPDNAVKVGLIPEKLLGSLKALGNTALSGAKACLVNDKYIVKAQNLINKAHNLDLSQDEFFMNAFIENMIF